VFMSHKSLTKYLIFYENVLRPLIHNFKSLYEDHTLIENKEYWEQYLVVNKAIATKVNEVRQLFPQMRRVWVHENNLLMVPFYVKKIFPESNIGFFFHSPFPSSDIFRMF